ncbi:MAG TPA: DUF445 family protein [Clostridiaceae bacterium]|nr:DUF445 family protein [Clostridiaceae bacterium]
MKFLAPIIVGAVIGYITNWLAIKMLFRPHKEVRIFGIRLPFTPGLIPKEKDRIAKSIGDAVGTYLLSPETFTLALLNDRISQHIESWVNNILSKQDNGDKSTKTMLEETLGVNVDSLLEEIEQRLALFICSQLKEKKFKDGLMNFIEYKIYDQYGSYFYNGIKEKAEEILNIFFTSGVIEIELSKSLNNLINKLSTDTRTLEKVLPDSFLNSAREFIYEHAGDIRIRLKELLDSPSIKRKLRNSISEIAEQNINKLVAIFITPDSIADKVIGALIKYVETPENEKNIASIMLTLIDRFVKSKISDIISAISDERKEQTVSHISAEVVKYLSDRNNQRTLVNLVEEKLIYLKPEIKKSILSFVEDEYEGITSSPDLCEKILPIVRDIIRGIVNKPFSLIIGAIDEKTVRNITNFIEEVFKYFVNTKMTNIIRQLNLSEIVENQIKGFDAAYTEDIILEIASRELKAITWLGALLGGIMGILMPFFEMLYN